LTGGAPPVILTLMKTTTTKLSTSNGNIVEISRRADPRITDVESCSHDDTGHVVVVTCRSARAASELAGEYTAWGLSVVDVESNCLVVAA
jgi:hypothetical protein